MLPVPIHRQYASSDSEPSTEANVHNALSLARAILYSKRRERALCVVEELSSSGGASPVSRRGSVF